MKEFGNHTGDSVCNQGMREDIPGHTQKQEAVRGKEPGLRVPQRP